MNPQPGISLIPLMLVVMTVAFTPGFFLLTHWVKMRRESSFLITVAMMIAAGVTAAWRAYQLDHHQIGASHEMLWLVILSSALLYLFAVPLGIKLYRAWTGIQVSPDEKTPGGIGVRAWLTPGNLIMSALVAGCATGAYDYPFFGIFALLVGCLLIQPLINTAGVPAPVQPSAAEPALTAEREKVLSLLEAGRISAEESADLLNALGSTSHTAKPAAPVSRQQRMLMIGAGLVLFGFFLPWFSYNPGKELNRMSGQMQGMMNTFSTNLPEGATGMPDMTGILGAQANSPNVNISGGDIGKGLGWMVLLLGLGTFALPHVATTMDATTRRMVSFIALGIGGIMLVWLISQNLRFVNVGVVLVLAGYAVEFLGLLGPRSHGVVSPSSATGRV